MQWAMKWWWLIVVILTVALVIGWEEKRCQTQAYQCRATYTAQLSTRLTIDQQAAAQQAIAAACEPNGYLCRLFSAASLPAMLLVIIGFGGIWAALVTLKAIEKQAEFAERDLIIASRAFLYVGEPEKTASGEARIPIENRGRVSAKILAIEITVIVHQLGDGKAAEIYRRSVKPEIHEASILPGDPHFSFFVYFPDIAKDVASQITVAGDVKYGIGFSASVDTLKFVRSFSVRHNVWLRGWNGVSADFRESAQLKKQKQNPT
jgi:hypothetical protein